MLAILGVSEHERCLLADLNVPSGFAINYHPRIKYHKYHKKIILIRRFHCLFQRKIIKQCSTFVSLHIFPPDKIIIILKNSHYGNIYLAFFRTECVPSVNCSLLYELHRNSKAVCYLFYCTAVFACV